jgi:hypothetical protein
MCLQGQATVYVALCVLCLCVHARLRVCGFPCVWTQVPQGTVSGWTAAAATVEWVAGRPHGAPSELATSAASEFAFASTHPAAGGGAGTPTLAASGMAHLAASTASATGGGGGGAVPATSGRSSASPTRAAPLAAVSEAMEVAADA